MSDNTNTHVINLRREARESEIGRLSADLKRLESEQGRARSSLEALSTLDQTALNALIEINGQVHQVRQALSILLDLANHEQALVGLLVSQIENYRHSLGLPNDTREVGSAEWARHNRKLQVERIRSRIGRELAILRARDERNTARGRDKAQGGRKQGPTQEALLTHFQERLFKRFQITMSMQAIEQINEFALTQPTMEVTHTGQGIKLLAINGQSVWALVTKSREGRPTLTTALTLEMVSSSAQQFGDRRSVD
jgi:hypothetical protein